MAMDPNAGAPVIPEELKQYNSYATDPIYQRYLTYAWTTLLAVIVLFTLFKLLYRKAVLRSGRWFHPGLLGVRTRKNRGVTLVPAKSSIRLADSAPASSRPSNRLLFFVRRLWTIYLGLADFPVPFLKVSLGFTLLIISFTVATLVCVVHQVPLRENPNRAGFIALALLPASFLFAHKSPLITLVISESSYAQLNILHRWSSRLLVLCALIHGSLWINSRLVWGLPILSVRKESLGVAALAFLCLIAISSISIVRRRAYNLFWSLHILSFPSFFILICYHTQFARPWVYPPLAFYGFDMVYRFLRFRLSEARLFAVNSQMTLIHLPYFRRSWRAGQFFNVRVFKDGMDVFESHTLTCCCAPTGVGTFDLPASAFGALSAEASELLESVDETKGKGKEQMLPPSEASLHSTIHINQGGMLFGARVCGDWSRRLNEWASKEKQLWNSVAPLAGVSHVQTLASIDGPYGGLAPSFDLGQYDNIILLCGGSGITFALACLDEVIGRAFRTRHEDYNKSGLVGTQTRRAELVWCMRSFANISWFAPHLMRLALAAAASGPPGHPALDLHITIYVTCLCDPEAVPAIPNMDVRTFDGHPRLTDDICRFMDLSPPHSLPRNASIPTSEPSSSSSIDSPKREEPSSSSALPTRALPPGSQISSGSLGVTVSGPEDLVINIQRWVSEQRFSSHLEIGYHGEVYAV